MRAAAVANPLCSARVAFTGRLASMTHSEAKRAVRRAGGRPVESVTRQTSVLVVGMDGWPLLGDGSISRKLRRAEELNARDGRVRIVSEDAFLEMVGLRDRRPALRKSLPAGQVCEVLGLDDGTLQRWEVFGLVRAEDGLYDFQDLVSLRTVAELVGRGVDPRTIGRSVRGLASVLPGTDRPLSQLQIVIEQPGSLLAEIEDRLVAPDGQLVIGFDRADRAPADADDGPRAPTARDHFDRAGRLQEQERLEDAAASFRAALRERPGWAEAHFHLGNVLRELGRVEAAEERFLVALEHDPGLAEAWYNLADLHEQADRLDAAIDGLARALAADPDYADAHYNMAHCCERAGRRADAARHWRAYLRLDPSSEWADVARRNLGGPGERPADESE